MTVNNVISPKGKGDKHVEEFPPNWSILRRRRTKFGSLLCPASLAALRARALWLLCPCLNTAPTAFAFVPAIRFSTSGGLFEGNSKGQKYLKIPNLSKLYDTMIACYNYYLIESKLHVDLSTCIRWPSCGVGPRQTFRCQRPLSSAAALVQPTSDILYNLHVDHHCHDNCFSLG